MDETNNITSSLVTEEDDVKNAMDAEDKSLLASQEMLQIVMQEASQVAPDNSVDDVPETEGIATGGQFIRIDTADGHSQVIQINPQDGQTQYIQVTSQDGHSQLLQVTQGEDGQPQVIQLTTQEHDTVKSLTQQDEQTDTSLAEEADGQRELDQTEEAEVTEHEQEEAEVTEHEQGEAEVTEQEEEEPPIMETPVTLIEDPPSINEDDATEAPTSEDLPENNDATNNQEGEPPSETQEKDETPKPETDETQPKRNLDTNKPIALTAETIVTVDGKKCMLRVDPETNHLVAYPVKPETTKRKRGRPRKVVKMEEEPAKSREDPPGDVSVNDDDDSSQDGGAAESVKMNPSEQENSAAEGLLGLLDTGPDGRRRSSRVRKKAAFLTDYETGVPDEIAGDESPDDADKEDEEPPAKRGRGRPKGSTNTVSTAQLQQMLMNLSGVPAKRGRGRPRRSPRPGAMPNTIPALIIPNQDGGQTVVMAPMQNLTGLKTALTPIQPKPVEGSTIAVTTPVTSITSAMPQPRPSPTIIIQNADGTQMELRTTGALTPGGPADALTTQLTSILNTQEGEQITISDALNTSGNETTSSDTDNKDGIKDEETAAEATVNGVKGEDSPSKVGPATLIQVPQHLVSLLLPKKEPVKIGLKASESELERLKCPRCDFQAYYQNQYQEHIAGHGEDLHKCKCCSYLSFDKDSLLAHFKENHPRCICPVCDFTAEHAYVIKRHMMRHNTEGCECEICGKTYKDQYILKMHVKMVHMPAEVLFECTVCQKKFTRKAHLKRHIRIHEPLKPFKCPHCDYRGCERSDITKHLLIHEEPKHCCEVCGKAFRHIKNKELHVKRHKGQKDYKCGVCSFYGYTFTDIRKHIERKHADSKHIMCDKCGSAFKTEHMLREHQKKQCELLMIEQALAVVDAVEEEDHTAAIAIPEGATVDADGNLLLVDGNKVNITVEQITLPDDQSVNVSLSEADHTTSDVHYTDGHISVSGTHQTLVDGATITQVLEGGHVEMPTQIVVSEAQIIDGQIDASQLDMSAVELVAISDELQSQTNMAVVSQHTAEDEDAIVSIVKEDDIQ